MWRAGTGRTSHLSCVEASCYKLAHRGGGCVLDAQVPSGFVHLGTDDPTRGKLRVGRGRMVPFACLCRYASVQPAGSAGKRRGARLLVPGFTDGAPATSNLLISSLSALPYRSPGLGLAAGRVYPCVHATITNRRMALGVMLSEPPPAVCMSVVRAQWIG